VNQQHRDRFDGHLEQVLAELPSSVRKILDEVPLYVEDYPSAELQRSLRLRHPHDLCGLYQGVPMTQRTSEHSGVLSDAVYLFRAGILSYVAAEHGSVTSKELKRQIRITLLHEIGHHHGLDEAELDELGYG